MKLSLQSVIVAVDALDIEVNPEDLSDETLMACVGIAVDRGLLSSNAADLRLVIERAYASLLRGDGIIAIAQLSTALSADTATRHLKNVAWEKKTAIGRAA